MAERSRAFILSVLIVFCVSLFSVNFEYQNVYLEKFFLTCLSLTTVYFLFEVLLEEYAIKKMKDSKTRYSFRKIISILSIAVSLLYL
jgi:hypothetical protein